MKKLLLLAVILIVLISFASALMLIGGRSPYPNRQVEADDITDPIPQPLAKSTTEDIIWSAKADDIPNGGAKVLSFGMQIGTLAYGGGSDGSVKLYPGNGTAKVLSFGLRITGNKTLSFAAGVQDETAKTDIINGGGVKLGKIIFAGGVPDGNLKLKTPGITEEHLGI